MAPAGRWRRPAGPSVQVLGRTLARLLAVAVALVAVYETLDQVVHRPGNDLLAGAGLVALGIFVVRAWPGRLRPGDLALLAVPCLLDLLEAATSSAVLLPLSTTVLSSLLAVACVIVLNRAPGLLAGALCVLALGAAQLLLAEHAGRHALDMVVINLAFVATGAGLVELLHRAALANDDLYDTLSRVQVRELRARQRRESEQLVRRVIHDDVITALRVLAEPRAGDPEHAREACRAAVVSIRATDGAHP